VAEYRLAGVDKFVAGRDHGYRRPPCDAQGGQARRSSDGDLRAAQANAGREQQVAGPRIRAAAVHVLPGLHRDVRRQQRGAGGLADLLDLDDCIAAAGQAGTGHDLDARRRVVELPRRVPGGQGGGDTQPPRAGGNAVADHRDAVHGHPIEGRRIALRQHRLT
jgi:hypothetical protein